MNYKKGEIATIITIGTVILLGLSVFLPQIFNKTTSYKSKAAEKAWDKQSCENVGGWFCAGECADINIRANYEGNYGTTIGKTTADARNAWYEDKASKAGFDPSYCQTANVKCTSGWYCYQDNSCLPISDTSVWVNTYKGLGNEGGFNQWIQQKEEKLKTSGACKSPSEVTIPTPTTISSSTSPAGPTECDLLEAKGSTSNGGKKETTSGQCNIECCEVASQCTGGRTCGLYKGRDNGYCRSNSSCDNVIPSLTPTPTVAVPVSTPTTALDTPTPVPTLTSTAPASAVVPTPIPPYVYFKGVANVGSSLPKNDTTIVVRLKYLNGGYWTDVPIYGAQEVPAGTEFNFDNLQRFDTGFSPPNTERRYNSYRIDAFAKNADGIYVGKQEIENIFPPKYVKFTVDKDPSLATTAQPAAAAPTPSPAPVVSADDGSCPNDNEVISAEVNSMSTNFLDYPYDPEPVKCIRPTMFVIHWSASPNFAGNGATRQTLVSRGLSCGFAIDANGTLQMNKLYGEKVLKEACVGGGSNDFATSVEINGVEFDLWVNSKNELVNPYNNEAIDLNPNTRKKIIDEKRQYYAEAYGKKIEELDWGDEKYLNMMKVETQKALELTRWVMGKYRINKSQVYGHFQLTNGKTDPGGRYLNMIKNKL